MSLQKRSKREFLFEALEVRAVLSGSGVAATARNVASLAGAGCRAPTASSSTAAVSRATPGAASRSNGANISPIVGNRLENVTKLTTTITDPSGTNTATGTAIFEQSTKCGKTYTELTVTVTGATAGAELEVFLNQGTGNTATKTLIGTITVDEAGNGKLVVSSKPNASEGELPLPDGFPTTIAAGNTISIGTDLTGTLAKVTSTDNGNHHGNLTISRVAAKLSDPTGVDTLVAKVSYTTVTRNGTTVSIFNVCVSGGTEGQVVDVKLAGSDTAVASITLDANGRGRLTFSSNPKGNELAFPTGFPTLASGTTVTVGSLSGVLETVTAPFKRGRH